MAFESHGAHHRAAFLALWTVALATAAFAATVTVDWAGNGDFDTIQDALDASSHGDTVLVLPGTYHEHLYMGPAADGVALVSESGSEQTIVTGDSLYTYSVLRCEDVGPATLIQGFTIRAGNTPNNGAGIQCLRASPVIRENIITACWSRSEGGGISSSSGDVRIEFNTVSHNQATDGGGIAILGGSTVLSDNTVLENTALGFGGTMHGGGILMWGGTHTLSSNIISWNTGTNGGGGIAARSLVATTLDGNVLEGNSSPYGGGLYVTDTEAVLIGNVMARNSSSISGSALRFSYSAGETSLVEVRDNVLFGNACASSGAISVRRTPSLLFEANYLSNDSAYELTIENAQEPDTLNFTGNWWGTDDPGSIASLIWDCNDDPGIQACVDFSDWCTDPSCAGQVTSVPEAGEHEPTTWSRIKSIYR